MKTSDLTGNALDWAVAKCEGDDWLFETYNEGSPPGAAYSTDQTQGGLIIDREGISTRQMSLTDEWAAKRRPTLIDPKPKPYFGPTRLIAAMRCFIASKLGDEVELPKELT